MCYYDQVTRKLTRLVVAGEEGAAARSGTPRNSHDPATAHQPHQEQYDRDHQQNPDEVAECVAADHPQKPKDDQDYRNGLEHV